jgi:hypothetical protein
MQYAIQVLWCYSDLLGMFGSLSFAFDSPAVSRLLLLCLFHSARQEEAHDAITICETKFSSPFQIPDC